MVLFRVKFERFYMSERDEEIDQQALDIALLESLSKVLSGPSRMATGFCHWCGEEAAKGALYCCKECAEDHEKLIRQKARGLLK